VISEQLNRQLNRDSHHLINGDCPYLFHTPVWALLAAPHREDITEIDASVYLFFDTIDNIVELLVLFNFVIGDLYIELIFDGEK